jgi:hypothetical protein
LDRPFDHQFDPQETGHGFIGHSGSTIKLRNSVIRSENPDNPGHFLCTGACKVDIEGNTFDAVGRTTMAQLDNAHLGPNREPLHIPLNQIGRYALHLHHVTLPFRVVDTILKNGRKVALAIHNSDGGLVDHVTVDNFAGAGIVLEAGSENDNVIRDCRVTNIRGDGLGVQGHDGGIEPVLTGDDTPGNPRRTKGGLFSEGAAYWARSIDNDFIDNYAADCDFGCVVWGRNQPGDGTSQGAHRFSGNVFERCPVGMSIQGTQGVFKIDRLTLRDCKHAIDASYNGTLRFVDCAFENGTVAYTNGFTGKLELINVTVKNFAKGFEILDRLEVKGGDFTGIRGPAFDIYYKATSSAQRQLIIRDAKFNGLSNRYNDFNKNRTYHAPQDVLVYNHDGEDYQVFMPQQAPDYVPVKNPAHPYRITPEPGLTNRQLWDKYRVCLCGKMIPSNVILRPGIGWTAPIPADLSGPVVSDLTVETTATTATIRFTTDEPASSRSEYATGDIKLGVYGTLGPVHTDLKTEHVVTLSGLKPNTKYNFIVQAFDEIGNLGGDTASAGINYVPRTFKTGAL